MLLTVSCLVAVTFVEPAQPMWVYLTARPDVSGVDRAADCGRNVSLRAIARREMRADHRGVFLNSDRSIDRGAIDAVLATGATERTQSRWLNAVSVNATAEQVGRLGLLACVDRIEPVRVGNRRVVSVTETPGEGSPAAADGFGGRSFYGTTEAQLAQIQLTGLHGLGYTGRGVIIGVLDTGFRRDHDAFNHPGHPLIVIAERDFINDDNNAGIDVGDDSEQHRHGTWCMSTIGGYAPDVFVGGAYDASFILCKTENVVSETQVEEDYYVEGLEFAESLGADVVTSSLGYIDWYTQSDLDGVTAVTTVAVNIAASHGVHCVTAAGNSGHDSNPATSTLGAPADGFLVITCGAVGDSGAIADFSSSGPTADGRIKPEILALGENTDVVSSRNTTGYGEVSGTSLSTPLVAAAVACLVEARPSWTPRQMRTALTSTASQSAAPDPAFVRGFGILNAVAALDGACPADWNGDDAVDSDDIVVFFGAWDSGRGDFDSDDDSDGDDIIAFFGAWDGGC